MVASIHVASLRPEPLGGKSITGFDFQPLGLLAIPEGVARDVRPIRVSEGCVHLDIELGTFLLDNADVSYHPQRK